MDQRGGGGGLRGKSGEGRAGRTGVVDPSGSEGKFFGPVLEVAVAVAVGADEDAGFGLFDDGALVFQHCFV